MAIATYADYLAKLAAPDQILYYAYNGFAGIAGHPNFCWTNGVIAGVAPTTSAVPTATTAGAIGSDPVKQNASAGKTLALAQVFSIITQPGYYWLCDRLVHQDSLVGNNAGGAQTTNLPTSALTRYTTGDGVMARVDIYGIIGTTLTTFTMSYTNQAGTTGRTSEAVGIGATGRREVASSIIMPLQSGDSGVRAVASFTTAASTGTAGSIGITLFKPLCAIILPGVGGNGGSLWDAVLSSGGCMPRFVDDACLELLSFPHHNASVDGMMEFTVIEI